MSNQVDFGAPSILQEANGVASDTRVDMHPPGNSCAEREEFLGQFDAKLLREPSRPSIEPLATEIAQTKSPSTPTPTLTPATHPTGRHFAVFRWARRVFGLVLVAALLWWLGLPFLFPVTSQAVINARTVPVRTPIDGSCLELDRDIGDTLVKGEPLMRVSCCRIDTSHLAELKTHNAELTAHRTRLLTERAASLRSLETSREAKIKYGEAIFVNLRTSIDEGVARAASRLVQSKAAQKRLDRQLIVQNQGAASVADIDDAKEGMERARLAVEEDEAVLRRFRAEMKAAENGLYLQKDALLYQLRTEELALKGIQLEAELHETEARLYAVQAELSTEEERVDRLGEVKALAPVSGIVWKRQGCAGQELRKSDTVYEVADGSSIFVEALFHQRYLASSIAPGAQATIKLTSGKTLQGKVRAIRTLGAADTESAFALHVASDDLKQVRVLIELPPEFKDASLIGRHVRVLITDEDPGPFQQTISWLFTRLGV